MPSMVCLALSFQQAESESESDPGQATRKKKKGELCEPQLALKTSYHIGSLLQEIFLSGNAITALAIWRSNPSAGDPSKAIKMISITSELVTCF